MDTLHTYCADPVAKTDQQPTGTLAIERPIKPEIDRIVTALKENGTSEHFMDAAASFYEEEAERVVDFLLTHMPQGLTDRIAGVLLLRKATLFVHPQSITSTTPNEERHTDE